MENTNYLIFAFILNNKVANLSVFENNLASPTLASELAAIQLGEKAIAVDVTRYAIKIGDTYIGGKFYRDIDGTQTAIEPIQTLEERVAKLESIIENLGEDR